MPRLIRSVLLSFLLVPQLAAADSPHEQAQQYTSCDAADQCVVVRGLCGSWLGINAKSETDYAEFRARMLPVIECSGGAASVQPARAECVNHRCVTIP